MSYTKIDFGPGAAVKMSVVLCMAWNLFLVPGCAVNQGAVGTISGRTTSADDLIPVKRVIIFQNGVAYIERRGEFQGNELHLKVHPSQIGDILKTITVMDLSGGHARSLSLPVDLSSKKALEQLPKIGLGQGDLYQVLNALRGALIEVKAGWRTVRGRLVGFDQEEGKSRLGVLDDKGVVEFVNTGSLKSLRILDKTLERGLEKGLDIALGQDAWRAVNLTIFLDQSREKHDLVISYLVEMPVWKPTYRLVVNKGEGKVLVQAWAIIDNVTGSNWQDINLTLTTGSPVSFHYDLYTPRFIDRPDLTPRGAMSLAPPPAPSAGYVRPAAPPIMPMVAKKRRKPSRRSRMASRSRRSLADDESYGLSSMEREAEEPMEERNLSERTMQLMTDTVRVQARTRKIGAAYSFEIGEPMTVPDRSSTMIAILNKKVPGEPVYYYNPQPGIQDTAVHPFKAVRIVNDTGTALEAGPLAVIRNGAFAGEGLAGRLENGHESYIAYALETGVNVEYNPGSSNGMVTLSKIHNGVVETKYYSIKRHSYLVKATSKDAEPLSFIAGLSKMPGWKVKVEGGKLISETGDKMYFSTKVVPGKETRLKVTQRYPMQASYKITDRNAQRAIEVYVSSKDGDGKIKAQLQPLMKKIKKLSITRDRINTLERQRSDLSRRADEIRQNLKLLKRSKNKRLKAAQTSRLMAVDRKLSTITDKLVESRTNLAELKVELSNMVEKLDIEI
ncbi:MAG: DUF4139 domain-containing protein [Deltaproteobacteria bacterium]|nr:DUF4139 domain-containing protein [Deltaproteobacteria bacterium]